MTAKRNPKSTAITAQRFIHCLLDPKAPLPCGGEDPDFGWFDEADTHLNAVHFKLKDKLQELREWKKKALIRAFTQNLAWEETEFWEGHFIKSLLGEQGVGISYKAKQRLLAHAFANHTVSDLEMVSSKSRHIIEESREMRSIVEGLVSPKVIQNHITSLLFYIRLVYPFPNDEKARCLYLEGTDGGLTTRCAIISHHNRVRRVLRPIIDELVLFLPVQSITWKDLELHKYPMERESDYTYWMWDDRFWTP